MKLTQLSVFLENRPGRLAEVCAAFAAAGINIETTSLVREGGAEGGFGVLRLLVKDPDGAFDALKDKFTVKKSEVLAVQVSDETGALAKLLELVAGRESLNIEYMYGFSSKKQGVAAIVFCFNDVDDALELFRSANVALVGADELFA